ncbi:hypothetical protein HUU40_25100 [candidate division KSB1 bacterium]|nr:hypothetical protein [candidate division KSB1 bacterium]
MNTKQRVKQAEKELNKKPRVMTWKEFIHADIATIDAYAKANGLPSWAEFIAKA